jgi:hypothetical protein
MSPDRLVSGAGDDRNGENPHVTSKFDRMHGHPRKPSQVVMPGGTAEPMFKNERHEPSHKHVTEDGHKVHGYEHDHPAMGGMADGAKAVHPTHVESQEAYEKHGYGGKR